MAQRRSSGNPLAIAQSGALPLDMTTPNRNEHIHSNPHSQHVNVMSSSVSAPSLILTKKSPPVPRGTNRDSANTFIETVARSSSNRHGRSSQMSAIFAPSPLPTDRSLTGSARYRTACGSISSFVNGFEKSGVNSF